MDTIAPRSALDVVRVTLTFDPASPADRERIARVYRHARVVLHETRDDEVSIVADVPRRLAQFRAQANIFGDLRFRSRFGATGSHGYQGFGETRGLAADRHRSDQRLRAKDCSDAGRDGAESIQIFCRLPLPPPWPTTPRRSAMSRGWAFLQSGDLRTAEHEFGAALKAEPAFYPGGDVGSGDSELARKDAKAALPHFEHSLELSTRKDDVSAQLGRGQALIALNRESDALGAFEAALAADPSQTELARRIEVLKFRRVEQGLARARDAAKAGMYRRSGSGLARSAAIASSPDSAFLYRELAGVERQNGDSAAALEHFRKAAALDSGDARSHAQIGELLEAAGDFEGAAKVYGDSLAIEPVLC